MSFSLDRFFGVENMLQSIELNDHLNSEIFTVKDTGLSPSVFVTWQQLDLLFEKKEKGWKKFSFTEYVWIKILDELRAVGVPTKTMKNIKENLFQTISFKSIFQLAKEILMSSPDKLSQIKGGKEDLQKIKEIIDNEFFSDLENDFGVTYFFLMLTETILTKKPVSLVIFKDGSFLPWSDEKSVHYTKEDIKKATFQTNVRVSISEIIVEFLRDEKNVFHLPRLNILTPNEYKIIQLINEGNCQAITINFKDGKPKSLDLQKTQNVKKTIIEILRENNYQDIEITTHGGVITKIKNIVKVILE